MDIDRPAASCSAVDGRPLRLLLHETVVGRPSPPASFLATVRLRRPSAVTTVVVVPAGEPAFEHATVEGYGSTPRTATSIDLLFNVRYAPPAIAPLSSRANKLQKVVLDYRPDAVDGRGRSGGQAFSLDMPDGVSTNLLLFRSSLPILTVLIYGRPTGPAIAPGPPLPEPDWSTYVRVLTEGEGGARAADDTIFGLAITDARLPFVRALALLGARRPEAQPGESDPAGGPGVHAGGSSSILQGRLHEVVDTLLQGGKQLTARLKKQVERQGNAMQIDDDAPEPAATRDDLVPALQLALEHLIELLDFARFATLEIVLPSNAAELGLLAGLLLVASAADGAEAEAARGLTAGVVGALFGHEAARAEMTAAFASAAVGPSMVDFKTLVAAGSVWDLTLWAVALDVEPTKTAHLSRADRASFTSLFHSLAARATNPTAGPRPPMASPPTPAALLTYLTASIQIASAVEVVTSTGRRAETFPTRSLARLEEEGQLRLTLDALRLWSADPVSAALLRTTVAQPSTLLAVCHLTAHPDDETSASAVALLNGVLADAASAPALSAALIKLPSAILERLLDLVGPDARLQIEVARLCAYPAQILPTLRQLAASALESELGVDDMFELELWLHHLGRQRQETTATDDAAVASTLLEVEGRLARAQRALLAQDTSFARDRHDNLDRAGALLSLARMSALVFSLLGPTLQAPSSWGSSSSERALRSSFVRQATANAARALGVGSYVASRAFLDAFCPTPLQPALSAAVAEQALIVRLLVEHPAEDDNELDGPSMFDTILEGLLDAALADPAVVASPAVTLLLSIWPRAERHTVMRAMMKHEGELDQLSIFLADDLRSALDERRRDMPRDPDLPPPSLAAAISALEALDRHAPPISSAADPLIVSSHDLLSWLHPSHGALDGPIAKDGRPSSASPQKLPFALSSASPPTTKTYSKQEFRAPRTIPGAGGGLVRVGNVSRAPSRHVDDFESFQATTPSPLPAPPVLIFRKDV